jgi:lytic murein transglycosylase
MGLRLKSFLGRLARLAAIVAIAGTIAGASALAATKQEIAAYRKAVNARYEEWIKELRVEALDLGIRAETFDAAMKGVELDWSLRDLAPPDLGPDGPPRPVVEKKSRQTPQPEFDRPAKYFPRNGLAYVTRLGRQYRDKWKDTLAAIEKRFQVEPHVVLAIWGRETAFGRARLPYYAVEALATQAFMGRRAERFREELLLALKILDEGHVTRAAMKSSWAGAMGHTQFMPSDFGKYAVDFNGDGKRDIWATIPDALANYLSKNGWEMGKTWGYEIRLPEDFDCTLEGVANARTIEEWVKLGITRTRDRKFRKDRLAESAYLVAPAGSLGPAFLVLSNFAVFRTYNKADLYALYVGHVADRIAFGGDFEAGWSRVESFTRDEMKRLQRAMAAAGIEVGKIDGLMGTKTRSAVGQWQRKLGRKVTCYPRRSLLKYAEKD